ncbi:hypothetical protein V7024_13630 [Bacillus sp. JJ864]|uniref:hypothetical protein n=1 Tax=Bacillus sp. JJ864 TaxID=3122975 RepID=UPI002FFFF8EF
MRNNFNENNAQLSPPWNTYFNEIKFSIGVDPEVTVGPLIPAGNGYIILITVTGNEKARALATLLKPTMNFGNVNVNIFISNREGQLVSSFPCPLDAFEIAHLVRVALKGNPYFVEVVAQPQLPGGKNLVYPVFKPEVIQFFNDDISNLCNTFVAVAANVFKDVMKGAVCGVPLLFSTGCNETSVASKAKADVEVKNKGTLPRLFYK